MTGPERLLESAKHGYTRVLLRSAVLDEPDDAAFHRMVAGLSTVAGLGAAETVAFAGSSAAAHGAAIEAAARTSFTSLVLKWLGLGAVAGLATAGGATYVVESSSTPSPLAASVAQVARAAQRSAGARPGSQSDFRQIDDQRQSTPGERTVDTARAHDVKSRPGVGPATGNEPYAAPAGSLAARSNALVAEVTELDRARKALARKNATAALRALDAYSAVRRTGVLDREATIIRIDALVAAGQKARAAELARRYVAEFPRDPHLRRLEPLLGDR
jgi:hypothetical protein